MGYKIFNKNNYFHQLQESFKLVLFFFFFLRVSNKANAETNNLPHRANILPEFTFLLW